MIERLKALTTDELDRSAEKLVCPERNAALLIAHIAEMSRRTAALERGHKSLLSPASRD